MALQDGSSMWLRDVRAVRAGDDGGGFLTLRGLFLNNSSVNIFQSSCEGAGGGFASAGDFMMEDSVLNVQDTSAEHGGGFFLFGEMSHGLHVLAVISSHAGRLD